MRLYELVDAYKASDDFARLAPNSQVSYQQMIDAVYHWGMRGSNVDAMSVAAIDSAVQGMIHMHGRPKAIHITKVMRKIWNWGYRHEYIQRNPWAKMGIKGTKPRTRVWTHDNIIKIIENSPEEFGLFIKLLYLTGQRPIDILVADYQWQVSSAFEPTLTIDQQKTGKTVIIPIPPDLASILRKMKWFSPVLRNNYLNTWSKVKAKINDPIINDLQLRDIRRTVSTQMADGGATDAQIRSVLGHSGHSKLPETVYVQRSAQQARDGLALRTMAKEFRHYAGGKPTGVKYAAYYDMDDELSG